MIGHIFTDLGSNHFINDPNGEPKVMALVTAITAEGIVLTEDKQNHGFYEGDHLVFREVIGMESLNGKTFQVKKVLSPFSFQVESLSQYGTYVRNGFVEEVKVPQKVSFKSLRESFEEPQADAIDADMDFENLDKIHLQKCLVKTLWKVLENNSQFQAFSDDSNFQQFLKEEIRKDYSVYTKANGGQHEQERLD